MKKFNVRVYGLLIRENSVLALRETRFGLDFIKFPGGGLEWGEGVSACLQREFREELNIEIEVNELFHINDDFVQSFFNPHDQVLAIYHMVSTLNQRKVLPHTNDEFPVWISIDESSDEIFHFPIDKVVFRKLQDLFKTK
jgi:8-oxo-dGTP diphosphatase